MDQFPVFAKIVAKSFQSAAKQPEVFVTSVEGDALYAAYLAAFPEGTNPIYKTNTEHDCSCCKQFIRRVGNVVTIENGKLVTIWDEAAESAPVLYYRVVAAALRDLVASASVADIFRVAFNEGAFGAKETRSLEDGNAKTWSHFYTGPIPERFSVESPGEVRGSYKTTVQVFERGLVELSPDAVETVIGLIEAKNLYRGEEHLPSLVAFQKAQREYQASSAKDLFVWTNAHGPAARFRNTVIGTLVQDLSEGKDLEHAVKSFETKVAPTNYKRTTALITPGMVKKAMETIQELGLEPALERRFATLADISVNDVKWVDNDVKPKMKNGLEHTLLMAAAATKPAKLPEGENISLEDFVAKVLPTTTGLEVLFKNELLGNLASLTAPVHPEPKQLFKWTNDFAWSYGGNVADSIKERVRKAGGKVDGAALRVSLSWFNYDDLDLHIIEPKGGRICFHARRGVTGGALDVDMNAGGGTTREPVENIVWTATPPDGEYRIVVNNYNQRETSNPGFVVEVESGGRLMHFTYNKTVRDQADIAVATFVVTNGVIDGIGPRDPGISSAAIKQDKWGLKTEEFVKVAAVTLSPNYWGDNAVGNKHTFFVLDGCQNDEAARGFYNEFLHPRLEPHRKVFEVIGEKTKCQPTEGQLSGLGFSSTKKESFVVRAQQGKKQRVYNVSVGV